MYTKIARFTVCMTLKWSCTASNGAVLPQMELYRLKWSCTASNGAVLPQMELYRLKWSCTVSNGAVNTDVLIKAKRYSINTIINVMHY